MEISYPSKKVANANADEIASASAGSNENEIENESGYCGSPIEKSNIIKSAGCFSCLQWLDIARYYLAGSNIEANYFHLSL